MRQQASKSVFTTEAQRHGEKRIPFAVEPPPAGAGGSENHTRPPADYGANPLRELGDSESHGLNHKRSVEIRVKKGIQSFHVKAEVRQEESLRNCIMRFRKAFIVTVFCLFSCSELQTPNSRLYQTAPRSIISCACVMVASVMVLPPSIRAISSTRSCLSSSFTSVLVRSFFTDLETP